MYFDPSDNLFGAPLIDWLIVAAIWAAPFLILRILDWLRPLQEPEPEKHQDEPAPPTDQDIDANIDRSLRVLEEWTERHR